MTDRDKTIEKIAKLLALSASPHEGEASLAMEKAGELLAKHGLIWDDVESVQNGRTELVLRWVQVKVNRTGWVGNLAVGIGSVTETRTVRRPGSNTRSFFMGFEKDVAVAEHLFVLILRQVQESAETFRDQHVAGIKGLRWAEDEVDAYLHGMVRTVRDRLDAATRRTEELRTADARALVPRKTETVDRWMTETLAPKKAPRARQSGSLSSYRRGIKDGEHVRMEKAIK